MENAPSDTGLLRRCANVAGTVLREVLDVLAIADLNPHEGRLRGSVMPSVYIDTPDFPPLHDDTITTAPPESS